MVSAVDAPAIAGRVNRSPCSGSAGCHTRRSATIAPAESSEATMSVTSTERKFEQANWPIANAKPPTIAAGHVCRIPRLPSTMPISTSGTTRARNGVWRPTMAPRSSEGRLVTSDSVMIGVAIAPNATGAVLATSATAAAWIGLKPTASSIAAVIATGAPKPASASISAPNENAMMTAWIRWSSEILANDRRRTAKWPVSSVML